MDSIQDASLRPVLAVVPVAFALSYRSVLMVVGRWIFARRYCVELGFGNTDLTDSTDLTKEKGVNSLDSLNSLKSVFKDNAAYLVLPNHPAMVDPMLVCTALWKIPLRILLSAALPQFR